MSEEKAKPEEKKPQAKATAKIAIIRIKGPNKTGDKKNDTLDMLKLFRKNFCVIIENTPSMMGMVKRVQDKITWGEVDDSTIKELTEKRGEKGA